MTDISIDKDYDSNMTSVYQIDINGKCKETASRKWYLNAIFGSSTMILTV